MFQPHNFDISTGISITFLNTFDFLKQHYLSNTCAAYTKNQKSLQEMTSIAFYQEAPFVKERQRQYAIEQFFSRSNCYALLFLKAMRRISEKFMRLDSGEMQFISESSLEWVECYSSLISTLPLIATKLANTLRHSHNDQSIIIRKVFNNPIIPLPDDFHMKALMQTGFAEVHMHFANSAHPVHIWDQVLKSPMDWIKTFWDDPKLRQIWHYLLPYVKGKELYNWIQLAKLIREWLICWILNHNVSEQLSKRKAVKIENACCNSLLYLNDIGKIPLLYKNHPAECLKGFNTNDSPIVLEGALWTLALYKLQNELSTHAVRMLHLYHIISTLIFKLSVHQLYFTGFDLFDGLSQSPLREVTEKKINQENIYQIVQSSNLKILEVRIAGKETEANFIKKKLAPVVEAYEDLVHKSEKFPDGKVPKFGVICHFIKKPDTLRMKLASSGIGLLTTPRHVELRNSLVSQLTAFMKARKNSRFGEYLVGIDGAGNELHTPPEVFAPIFRELKYQTMLPVIKNDLKTVFDLPKLHYTFHAGEDFSHLISGIRTIYEAIHFLDLPLGSRLGHCIALGFHPELWYNLNSEVKMSKMNRMDDLVWIFKFIEDSSLKQSVEAEIDKLCIDIYHKSYNPYVLLRAWQWRFLGVSKLELLLPSQIKLKKMLIEKGELDRFERIRDPIVREIFLAYHFDLSSYKEGEKLITVKTLEDEQYSMVKTIESAQSYVKKNLLKKKIAIETCPTSNIRISQLNKLDEHPIFTWHDIEKNAACHLFPLIATDNPGYCQTSIPMEYSAIKQAALKKFAINKKSFTMNQIQNWLNELNKNTHTYSFVQRAKSPVNNKKKEKKI